MSLRIEIESLRRQCEAQRIERSRIVALWQDASTRAEKYRQALVQIVGWMGPEIPENVQPEGFMLEADEVLRIAREALDG